MLKDGSFLVVYLIQLIIFEVGVQCFLSAGTVVEWWPRFDVTCQLQLPIRESFPETRHSVSLQHQIQLQNVSYSLLIRKLLLSTHFFQISKLELSLHFQVVTLLVFFQTITVFATRKFYYSTAG